MIARPTAASAAATAITKKTKIWPAIFRHRGTVDLQNINLLKG